MATSKTAAKPAAKPAAKKEDSSVLTAYCMSTKQKEVLDNGVVEKTARGQYIVKGTATDAKHKVSAIVSQARAEELIKAKVIKKGF